RQLPSRGSGWGVMPPDRAYGGRAVDGTGLEAQSFRAPSLFEVVGKGGMGMALRARDTKLKHIVALKVLPAPPAASGTARQRFAREAPAAAIRGEHVVAIYAVRVFSPGNCPVCPRRRPRP